MKHCSWCDNEFKTDISYQIYCSATCRDAATKEKIAARYVYARRQKRKGKDRKCKQCDNKLSIYNDDNLCIECNINPSEVSKILKQIKGKSK
jgi:hypothetical protein